MKKLLIFLLVTGICSPCFAATVGGADISIPKESLRSKDEAVNMELDRFDFNMNLKASAESEFIFKSKLSTSSEVTDAKISQGQSYMLKLSNNFNHLIEPYIKIGTSHYKIKWKQNNVSLSVDSDQGFMWVVGAKTTLADFDDYGVKLTLDAQYRDTNLEIDRTSISSTSKNTFDMTEFQATLLLSKKFVLPIGLKEYYIVPYGGLDFLSSEIDVSFKDGDVVYSTYKAHHENALGLVLGLDLLPSLLDWYLFNFEVRLINETAFTIGGTMKF